MAQAQTSIEPEASSSRTQTQAEKAEIFKRLHPDEYLERFLAQGYRPDGRTVDGWRDVSINTGKLNSNINSLFIC